MAKKQVTVSLRKPPSPETIDAFVRGTTTHDEPVETPQTRLEPPVSSVCLRHTADTLPEMDLVHVVEPAVVFEPSMAQDDAVTDISPPNPIVVSPLLSIVTPAGTTLRPVTIYLREEVAERLTTYCITNDRDVNNVVGEVLEAHFSPPPVEVEETNSSEPVPEAEPSEPGPQSAWSRLRSSSWQPMERISQWGRSVRGFVERATTKVRPASAAVE